MGIILAVWTVVWQAPRDLPLNATEFWFDYVAPRAITRLLYFIPALAVSAATMSVIFLADGSAPTRDRSGNELPGSVFESRTLAFLHLTATGWLVASAIALIVLVVTQSQSTLGPVAVFGPGLIGVVLEGYIVDRAARGRAARVGVRVSAERFRVQREFVSLSAMAEAIAIVRRRNGQTPPTTSP